jgi:hypothetical protein
MTNAALRVILIVALISGASGCVPLSANSPIIQDRLKVVSAGHTGCTPDENLLSNVVAHSDGTGIWNATCKGKMYLCTAVASGGNSVSFSCAPVAQ